MNRRTGHSWERFLQKTYMAKAKSRRPQGFLNSTFEQHAAHTFTRSIMRTLVLVSFVGKRKTCLVMYTQISKRRLNTLHKTANSENGRAFFTGLGGLLQSPQQSPRAEISDALRFRRTGPAACGWAWPRSPLGAVLHTDSRETACLTASQTRADALNSRVRVNFWLQIISTCENETPTTSLRLTSRLALVTKKVLLFPSVD